MRGLPFFVAITAFYLMATTQSVPLFESVRLEEASDVPTSTFDGGISSQDEEFTDTPVSLHANNGTIPFGRGSSCTQQSDCDDALVCLPSNTCGCPELAPVMLQEADGVVCVSDYLVRSPLPAAIFPAALLIIGFVVLGVLGYHRLHKPRCDKGRQVQQLTSLPNNIGYSGRDRINNDFFDGSLNEHECDANNSVWSWLRSFVSSVTMRLEAAKRRCRWSFSGRSPPCANSPKRTPVDRVATQTGYSNETSIPPQLSSVLPYAPSGTTDGTSPQFLPPASIAMRRTHSAASSAVSMTAYPEARREGRIAPLPRPRTRISTLSTSTLMPCNRATRRGTCSSSAASSKYGTPPSFWVGGMSNLCEPIEEGIADEPNNTVMFTESELQGGVHRNFRSEELAMPIPTSLRPVVSDHGRYVEVICPDSYSNVAPEKHIGFSSGRCCGDSCPNIHFYGPSTVSSSKLFGRGTESRLRLSYAEHSARKSLEALFTRSEPTWPRDRVVGKGPDRKARTWEALTAHVSGARPKETRKRFVSAHIGHGRPSLPTTTDHRSTSRDDSGCRYAGATRSIGAPSVAAAGRPSHVRSLASPLCTPKRDFGSPGRGSVSRSPGPMSLSDCACQPAARVPQVAQAAPFSSQSQTLDSERDIAVRCAGRKDSRGPAVSSKVAR
ncbi:uncharacterized protein [Dermacentor albipictus]|uniref:uncharacterized protein isoform X2 n=1 Tax=Dermacentor albipictus TaxID=60249 RepID=UPI0031FCC7E2